MQYMIMEVFSITGAEVQGVLKGTTYTIEKAEELRKKEKNERVWVLLDYQTPAPNT